MGFFSPPKPPAPPKLPEPPKAADPELLTEARLKRQRAAGTAGNIMSSLKDSVKDESAATRISKLLG